jgi:hypothetical protein
VRGGNRWSGNRCPFWKAREVAGLSAQIHASFLCP